MSVLLLVAVLGVCYNPSLRAQSKSAETRISVIDVIGQDMVKMLDNLTEGERDPTKRLPLRPVVDKVLSAVDQAPVFRQADTSVALAKGQKREALSRFLPQISAGVGKGTRTFDTQTADGFQEQSGSYEQRSVQVSQLIFDFGTSIFGHSAASRRLEAAEAKRRAMRSEVILATVTSFYEVQRALLQVRLSRENLAARRSFVEFVKERAELGASSSADVVRAQSRVAEALDALSSSLQSLSRAQATYRQYFADEAEPYTLPDEIVTEDLNLNNIEEYIQSHPLLIEAELNKEAAQKEFYAARGQLIGGIYAEASLSDTKDPGETEFRSDNTFTVRFKADLFTGGSQTARVAQSSARYDLASLELDKVRLDLVRDLRDAFAEYNGNIAAVSARMLVFKGAEDSYAISKDLYAFSRTSLFEVLKSQEELYTAGQRLIDSIINRAISKYRLLHASQQLVDRMQRVAQ